MHDSLTMFLHAYMSCVPRASYGLSRLFAGQACTSEILTMFGVSMMMSPKAYEYKGAIQARPFWGGVNNIESFAVWIRTLRLQKATFQW